MKHFLLTVLGTLVGIFLFFFFIFMLIGMIGAIGSAASKKPQDGSVITIDLRSSLQDHSAGQTLFGGTPNSVVGIARKLNAAKTDKDIKGVFIRANEFGMVPASAEEIRIALKDFQTSEKFVIVHSQGFETTSLTGYTAISGADEIWQQASTPFSVAGMRSEVPFYGGVFEKIEAQPQIEQFHEYKSAANVYTQTGFTDAHRESTLSLLQSIYDISLRHIAEDRGLSVEQVKTLLDSAPLTAEMAQESGLTDKLGHYLEARDYVKEKAGGDKITFIEIGNYELETNFSAPTIAFIGGQGPVVAGESSDGSNPFNTALSMGGDTLSMAFDAAAKDKKVKAILFRVSTPGGSATASDQIDNAITRAQEAGKPVIISMGQYAASGGYYVAARADSVVAMPTTITGSIGVLGGKVALEDSFAKVGYNIEDVNLGGEYVSAFSGDKPFTESQREAYRGQLADIYEDFTTLVAEGRDLPIERVQEIAKGRVWTGEQAQELGLVDHQGGFLKALEIAKEMAEIEPESKVFLKTFPRPKTTQQQLEEIFGASAEMKHDVAALREITNLPEVRAILETRARLQPQQELMMAPQNIE